MVPSIYYVSTNRRSCCSKGASIIAKMSSRLLLVTTVFVQMQVLTFAFNNFAAPRHQVYKMFSNAEQDDAATSFQSKQRPFLFPFLHSSLRKNDGDQESLDQARDSFFSPSKGPEPSQMPRFITDYLLKQRQKAIEDESLSISSNSETLDQEESSDSAATTSYLIAIPMEDAHDLALELESVQRAILYHCPVLVHACLVPAQMRLPLLYVHTKSSSPATAARDLRQLTRLVQNIVQDYIFTSSSSNADDDDHKHNGDDNEQGAASRSSIDSNNLSHLYREVNTDGIRPLVMTFETLQTSGPNHQVLYTVGKVAEESDTLRLSRLVSKLQQAVESVGWTTSLSSPYEQQQLEDSQQQDQDAVADAFQARVPFMRLPFNFEEYLEPIEEDRLWRTSEQGGNGISPIFWCQWWDDVFARDVRLRQIGIYPQQPVQQQTQQPSSNAPNQQPQQQLSTPLPYQQSPEEEFHIPYELIPLPSGNAALALKERQEQAQQQERLLQQFENLQNKRKKPEVEVDISQQDNQLLEKTQVRLEPLYRQNGSPPQANDAVPIQILDVEVEEEIDDSQVARDDESTTTTSSTPKTSSSQDTSSDVTVDDWTRERIRQVIEARTRNKLIFQQQEQANAASKRKSLPPIEENAVFLKYKNGSLVSEDSPYASPLQQQQQKRALLPPYPSREHFIGIWRAVTPPTGFPEETGEATKSDNLILRVDGTTAGGPTLDEEQQQKAAGGTWRLLLNNSSSGDNSDGGSSSARLRIRLVIPPKKERILVMEGDVTRICMTPSDLPLASSTFAIPELEERLEKSKEQLDDMLHCGGEVWIEDAITGNNKNEIGSFSLMKLTSPSGDPSRFIATIPRPVRNQD